MKQKTLLYIFVAVLFLPTAAFAVEDISDILTNLRSLINPFIGLILIISYVSGTYMIFRALGMLKIFGMPLTQQSRQGELAGPMVYLVVGAALIYLPTITQSSTATIFGESSPGIFEGGGKTLNLEKPGTASEKLLSYTSISVEGQWSDLIDTIILYLQFIGFIAFVRGWFIIAHAGQPGVQPGTVSRGTVHLVGGIIAINFVPFVEILRNSIFTT